MGVKGLWQLLESSSETVPLETLCGKVVAVDASIWLFQFVKALRDGDGNAVRGGHVKGFFSRICKLLFVGVKPVFVFDGATPMLKRATVRKRRERKSDASSSVERTAEKLLQQQLRLRALTAASKPSKNDDKSISVTDGANYLDLDAALDASRSATSLKRAPPSSGSQLQQPQQPQQPPAKKHKLDPSDAYLLPPQLHPLQTTSSTDSRLLDPTDLSHFVHTHLPSLLTDVESKELAGLSQDLQYQIILNLKTKSREANAGRVMELWNVQQKEGVKAFSQMQIDGLVRRNALTEKLHSVAKGESMVTEGVVGGTTARRMAGVRGREYVLVKDEKLGGGFVMKSSGSVKEEKERIKLQQNVVKQETLDDQVNGNDPLNLDKYRRMATMQPLSLRGILENDSIDAEDLLADDDVLFNDDYEYNQSGIMIEIPDSGSASVLPTITEEDDAPLFSDDDDEIPSVPRRIVPISSTMSDSEPEDEVFEEIPVPESNVVGEVEVLEHATQESIDRDEIFEAIPTKADSSLSSTVEPAVIDLNKDDEALFSDSDEDFHPNTKRSKTQQKPSVQPIEVIDEWEDVIVNERDTVKPKVMIQETNGNTHVSDEMSANDIWKMFQESGIAESTSGMDVLAGIANGAVADDMSPEEVMRLFERASEKPAANLDILARTASGAVPDEIGASEVMRLFAEQEAFGPQPEPPVNQVSSNARVTASSSFVSDETSVQQVMDLFKQQESELKGSSSTLKEAIDVIPSIAPVVEERQALLVNLVDPSNGPTYLLHNWKSLIPTYLLTYVPDAISLLENAHVCEIEELKSQLHGLERRLGKLADTGLGAEKKTAVEIVHRALEEVLGMRESMALAEALQREAEEEAEVVENIANNYEVTQVEEAEKVVQIRSPSPTPSDAGSDHSAHSLQERIRKMENGDVEEPEDENLVYEDAEDLTDIPQASEHEDREFLEFLAKSREMDRSGMQNDVQANIDKLMSQNRKEKRDSATISSDMIRECQDLLRLFGIPYIIAPMEAESQCAFLATSGLVDGIITDDSDVFLFGGSNVYKNMFNSNKFVECYTQDRIHANLGAERKHLILLAYLLGSDYTEGIDGIGVVSGMEIMNEFCIGKDAGGDGSVEAYLDGLKEFREWVISVQRGLEKEKEVSSIRRKLKSKAKNIELPLGFPDARIFSAYFRPEVNESMEPFKWGSPDIEGIRRFLDDKAGYSDRKTNEVLIPVIHEMDKRLYGPVQTRIDQFFTLGPSPTKIVSKRLQTSIQTLKGIPVSIAPRGRGGKKKSGNVRKQSVNLKPILGVKRKTVTKPSEDSDDGSSSSSN